MSSTSIWSPSNRHRPDRRIPLPVLTYFAPPALAGAEGGDDLRQDHDLVAGLYGRALLGQEVH